MSKNNNDNDMRKSIPKRLTEKTMHRLMKNDGILNSSDKNELTKYQNEVQPVPKEVQAVLNKKEKFRDRLKDKSKRNVQRVIYGRTLVIVLLLLLQFYIFLSMVFWLKEYSTVVYAALEVIALFTVIVVMNRRENPMFKLSWIILIMLLPVFGSILYIYVQNNFGFKLVTWRMKVLNLEVKPFLQQEETCYKKMQENDASISGIAHYIAKASGHPVYEHTNAVYFPNGEVKFEQFLIELNNAKQFIFLEYFIIKEGIMLSSVLEILEKKVAEGVEVRIMYDGLCTFTDVPVSYPKQLAKKGIKTKVYGPIRPILSTVQNNRDHRKIAVIDGRVAFTGGINLADEYINEVNRFGYWKDTAVMIRGEAVKSFTMMFLTMWNVDEHIQEKYAQYITPRKEFAQIKNDGFFIPYGDCPFDDYYVAKHIYLDIISKAQEYVYIMTPYLILDNETMEALCYAAARGVDVRIILPHIPDKKYAFWLAKSYYKELLGGGVEIYEFTPGFVHAKQIVADGKMAMIGSSNLDFRSFYLHFECGVFVYDSSVIRTMYEDTKKTLERCHKVTEWDCKMEPWYVKILGGLLRLVAPLM